MTVPSILAVVLVTCWDKVSKHCATCYRDCLMSSVLSVYYLELSSNHWLSTVVAVSRGKCQGKHYGYPLKVLTYKVCCWLGGYCQVDAQLILGFKNWPPCHTGKPPLPLLVF